MTDVLISVSTEGAVVAEVDLSGGDLTVGQLLDEARSRRAEVVWVHGGDLRSAGFTRCPGYVRLHADQPTPGDMTEVIDATERSGLLTDAFLGLWGHKRYDAADVEIAEGRVTLGLRVRSELVGLCQVWSGDRLVDGPGILEPFRTPERKAQLLGAACALLGDGPVDLDTWGEDAATVKAYRHLGFSIVVQEAGWELRLE